MCAVDRSDDFLSCIIYMCIFFPPLSLSLPPFLQVLAASDSDADEEILPTSGGGQGKGRGFERKAGSMATMSGGNDMMYMEYSARARPQHPLFRLRH